MPIEETIDPIRQAIKSRKEADANLLGGSTGTDALTLLDKANDESQLELIGRGTSLNALWGAGQWAERAMVSNDPNFKLSDHFDELKKDVPIDYWDEFSGVQSLDEAMLLKSQIKQELEDKQILAAAGTRGFVGAALAGIVDVDAPLMFVSGGSYLGAKVAATSAKAGIAGSRVAKAGEFAAAGLEAGLVTETANVLSRPTGEWTDIPQAGLGGIVFGGSVGVAAGLSKADRAANNAASNLRNDFAKSQAEKSAGYRDYQNNTGKDEGLFEFSKDTVGAASIRKEKLTDEEILTENVKQMRDKAQKFLRDNGVIGQMEGAFPNTPVGNAARRFYEFLTKTPAASDWDAMMNSNSSIAAAWAYKNLESPAGIARYNQSSALLNQIYHAQVAAPVNTKYTTFFNEWSPNTQNKLKSQFDPELRSAFDSAVIEELQFRYHDGKSKPNQHPAVIKMADAIDEASAKAVGVLQGRTHETAVRGSENLKPETGWFPQRWRGDKISAMIKEGVKRDAIEEALSNSYQKLYTGWTPDIADSFAKAVVRRAAAKERGIDTNLARMLDEEGRDFMEQYLIDNGITKADAVRMLDGLKGLKADQQKVSILKERKDVDLREPIPGSKYRIMDLVDTDIVPVWTRYSRTAAGSAALARNGTQKADRKDIINAIKLEEEANGGRKLSDDQLDAMFSYFEGGAFAGGLNPWTRRMLQTTNLSLLNSLGLTQAAETGVNIAAVGWEAFRKSAPKEVQDMLNGKNAPAMEELRGWVAAIDGDHRIYMDHLALDEMRRDPGHFAELGNFLDKMLVRGARVQGYVSGFYKMKQLQQRVAVRAMLYRLAQHYNGKAMSPERIHDLGLGGNTEARIGNYFKNGTVELSKDGEVLKLNLDKWKPNDVTDFAASLNRHAYQVVQQAMRGESTAWFHKDTGALLTHLKSFTILTMQKQLLRNARIMDAEATMAFVYSMATAGTVYALHQAIRGNEQNLDAERIMKGAFMLSNMTGWIPQWSDPLASMLGMDNLRFNHYGAQGVGGDVVGVPPALTTANRIAHIPSSAVKAVTGNAKNEDIYALQATPIIGNLYGFSYMFNSMKQ